MDATTVHELFEQQVRRTPDATAVICEGEELSYGELNARANRLARYLQRLGLGAEMLVALFVERSVDMITSLLGVLKAGAAYVPIDAQYPDDHIELVLRDCKPQLVLSQERLLDRIPTINAEVVCVDRDAPAIAREAVENLGATAGPLNLMYVIYTSGSTGRPKGVAIPHQGVCSLARAEQAIFAIDTSDRVLLFAALGFDASVESLTMALLNGGALYVPSEVRRRWRFAQVLQESGATTVTLSPSDLAALPPLELLALRRVIAAGEPCPPSLARTWSVGRSFYNAYGTTETSVGATFYRADRLPTDAVRVPIGEPMAGVLMYVLDPDLQPASDGQGELFIGGNGVGRGYVFQPAPTAERFLPDPFSGVPGARMYRSGDLVRWNDQGQLEHLGRVDDQVNIGGFRVEPAEIEAALVAQAGVRDAVVLANEDDRGIKRLTAYVVRERATAPPTPLALRNNLLARLPDYMVPADYVVLDELPLTPNGKLDRRGLIAQTGRSLTDSTSDDPVGTVGPAVTYRVVVNDEEQYSIWPVARKMPKGWRPAGKTGSLDACLAHVSRVWTDMRPKSLRDIDRTRVGVP